MHTPCQEKCRDGRSLAQSVSGHWGMADPVKAQGNMARKSLAFQQAHGTLKTRISAFTALPLASLDRVSLQTAVDDIALG